MTYRLHVLDGGALAFDRTTGHNVLFRSSHTEHLARKAPRSVQIGLLTPCNLRCAFCYRDTEAPSLLSYDFVVELAKRLEKWGVLELAFGGGEPFLFKRFAELVEQIHAETSLGINVTTNGMFLDRELAERLRGKLSEIRLSIYEDNDWRGRLALLRGHQVGANWLVTPANLDQVVPRTLELLARGAKNVLLLGYKGDDDAMRLDAADFEKLRASLQQLDGRPVRVDVCWYPELAGKMPFLFERSDCGAGDESVMITPDKQVQACSFAKGRVPFDTFEDLQRIYAELRATRPHANTGGCTRHLFKADADRPEVSGRILPTRKTAVYEWQAWASSNSGPYLLLARFKTSEQAEKLRSELQELYEEFLDFASSEDYEEWQEEHFDDPTPQMQKFAKDRGFKWQAEDGFAWEEVEEGGLEIRTIGSTLMVYHAYAIAIGEQAIATWAKREGADLIVRSEDPFTVRVSAATPKAQKMLGRALVEVEDGGEEGEEGKYVEVVDAPKGKPPWLFEITNRDGEPSRFVVCSSNIGGQMGAADFLMRLGELEGVVVELRRARA